MKTKALKIYVEKKKGYNVESKNLLKDLKLNLKIHNLNNVRIINRYNILGISDNEFEKSINTVFSEPQVDITYRELKLNGECKAFGVQFLEGQFDKRGDSAAQCIQIITGQEKPLVKTAKIIILEGNLTQEEFKRIKKYYINPVDSCEININEEISFKDAEEYKEKIRIIDNFTKINNDELKIFLIENNLSMNFDDLKFCQEYFKEEKRNPTITEIKVLDTYWSDHCRHTTFNTHIKNIEIEEGKYKIFNKAYEEYLNSRKYVYDAKVKPITLMDMATIGMKELKKKGYLQDLEESDEINACSIEIPVDVNGKIEKWLLMFKNETHNHPTEIEPFGGAATCLGGAIRDPLSGRSYVYQAMRITGSGDPRVPVEETLEGKLPQRKITLEAASGYSSYGNQIGLATGKVVEFYDEDFRAKRMELGAVIGAAPKKNVKRLDSEEGDVIILLGGKTGRDGCGGATGSSKKHTEKSIEFCGAQVQKGNAVEERKLQRLFRRPEVSKLIKKCNDFGAGGVSVAVGELAKGLFIDLDSIPKKYEGLDGTELSISESQERMAVVIDRNNKEQFMEYAKEENIESTIIAKVTNTNRLQMSWNGELIVDLKRDFLDSNGSKRETNVYIKQPKEEENYFNNINKNIKKYLKEDKLEEAWNYNLKRLNICSQKGLVERFDSSIGAATVLMPFGGKFQDTPSEGMVAKIPVIKGETNTCSIMTCGYNPKLSKWSPFHGALYSIVEAITRIVVCGGDYKNIRLTLQEYFEKLEEDKTKWGKPFSALLGAIYGERIFNAPAIGGKDSMSGTFESMNVPPTLVAFAVKTAKINDIISQEFKKSHSKVYLVRCKRDEEEIPRFNELKKNYEIINELREKKIILSSFSVKHGGVAEAISKMSFGNRIGMKFSNEFSKENLFTPDYGSIILELKEEVNYDNFEFIGSTTEDFYIEIEDTKINLEKSYKSYTEPLEEVFSTKSYVKGEIINKIYNTENKKCILTKIPNPKVFIPVFPGTNCEYDCMRAFEKAGASVEMRVFKNLNKYLIKESIDEMVRVIKNSQIIMLPGGFSAGDEPDGSGKFIANIFRNEKIKESIMEFIKNKDGLMLGICNGFQVLIKLGLVPYGEIIEPKEEAPTLTYNNIGRHVSKVVNTKIVSNLSPWFNNVNTGDVFSIPVSHGEGRVKISETLAKELFKKGQIATQYVDFIGNPSLDINFNPNGSEYAIEGITSPDGRILGKMAHSERIGQGVLKNIIGKKDQKIFEAGVEYFK